jgi:hypothetical protein
MTLWLVRDNPPIKRDLKMAKNDKKGFALIKRKKTQNKDKRGLVSKYKKEEDKKICEN